MQEILRIVRHLEELQLDSNKKLWALYTTGFDFGVEEAQGKCREAYRNKESFKTICRTLDQDLSKIDRRRIEILHRDFRSYHRSEKVHAIKDKIEEIETRLSDLLNKNRSVLQGREVSSVEIKRILEESPDRELRKQAYLSRAQVNRKLVDAGFLDLLSLRKEQAVACGASDFVTLCLEEDDLAPDLFDGWREQLAARRNVYRENLNRLAQRYLDQENYQPWDQTYLRGRLAPRNHQVVDLGGFRNVLAKVFRAYGFELDGVSVTFDVFSRENKSEWGYMFPIQKGKDVRVLANMDNRFSSYWVLLHETAHAVHFHGLDAEEFLLNRGVSGIVAEGFANFFGDLSYSKEFLAQFFAATTDRDETAEALREFSRLKTLSDMGNVELIANTLFDHELYRRELKCLRDVDELAWTTRRDSLHRTSGDVESGDQEPLWGHTIHHTTAPIYLHNYFLGDVMCEAMKGAFERKTSASWSERPGDFGGMWRDEALAPSGLYPFVDLFERITGEKPNIAAYLETIMKRAEIELT